jgi:hypothetical protein
MREWDLAFTFRARVMMSLNSSSGRETQAK